MLLLVIPAYMTLPYAIYACAGLDCFAAPVLANAEPLGAMCQNGTMIKRTAITCMQVFLHDLHKYGRPDILHPPGEGER